MIAFVLIIYNGRFHCYTTFQDMQISSRKEFFVFVFDKILCLEVEEKNLTKVLFSFSVFLKKFLSENNLLSKKIKNFDFVF